MGVSLFGKVPSLTSVLCILWQPMSSEYISSITRVLTVVQLLLPFNTPLNQPQVWMRNAHADMGGLTILCYVAVLIWNLNLISSHVDHTIHSYPVNLGCRWKSIVANYNQNRQFWIMLPTPPPRSATPIVWTTLYSTNKFNKYLILWNLILPRNTGYCKWIFK